MRAAIAAAGLLLAGCATNYTSTPSAKLCVDYMTLPSYNVHHGARAAELAKRGENCGAYTGAAQTRQQADQAFQEALQRAGQPRPTPTPSTQSFLINGKWVTCNTMGTVTTCN